jgi:hypothetical protein
MSKFYILAAVVLFWVALSASLLQVQLVASPVYKMRVPTYRSVPILSTTVAQAQTAPSIISYN